MNYKTYFLLIVFIAGFSACNKNDKNVKQEQKTIFKNPDHFPSPAYQLANNVITKEGFELGRQLFYDTKLSANNTISCGSCHMQSHAFAEPVSISVGIENRAGVRNSPPIMNLAWNPLYMWDGGVADLDLQSVAPITNHVEMDETVDNILKKLRSDEAYKRMFKNAYGNSDITSAQFLKALSQYMLMCKSDNAKYDSVMRKETAFTTDETAGYNVFKSKCNSCHKEPLFTDHSFRNNGIVNDDLGRYNVTLIDADKYKFKIPSLRNWAYTAPYMHNGSIATIEKVIRHYTNEIQDNASLDVSLKNRIQLSNEEQRVLLVFLNTLNDKEFVNDKALSK